MATYKNIFPHTCKMWSKASERIVYQLARDCMEDIIILNTYMRRKGSCSGYNDDTFKPTYYEHSFTYVYYYIPRLKESREYIEENDTGKVLTDHKYPSTKSKLVQEGVLIKAYSIYTYEEWIDTYDIVADPCRAYFERLYKKDLKPLDVWECLMDEACLKHPEWADEKYC